MALRMLMDIKEWMERPENIITVVTLYALFWGVPLDASFLQAPLSVIWHATLDICLYRFGLNVLLARLPRNFHWLLMPIMATAMIFRLSRGNFTPTTPAYIYPNNILSVSSERFTNVTR